MAGIPSEDDDGNAASKSKAPSKDDMAWVKSINMKLASLDDITDPNYKSYIKGLL